MIIYRMGGTYPAIDSVFNNVEILGSNKNPIFMKFAFIDVPLEQRKINIDDTWYWLELDWSWLI